ncbi:hypothetical protein SXCC_04604 [Gluconacetobacter sp. SXCC-1]|nr:hypothetical protein SXCC_04604 [Gluconacetobacter sp. SXCC-1]
MSTHEAIFCVISEQNYFISGHDITKKPGPSPLAGFYPTLLSWLFCAWAGAAS